MAFMRIVHPHVVTDTVLYDEVADATQIGTKHPLGLIMHAAGEIDGEWRVVEVWDSEKYAKRFDAQSLQPTLKAVTGKRAPLDAECLELHYLVTP
jgi:hypothetical protein